MQNFKTLLYTYFTNIRFWIIFCFIIRLYGITNPPLESAHNWRQSSVTMVARDFYEESSNILYPRIDIAGEKTGITGMEFPFLNYLIYLVSLLFGYSHWYGRLINLIISSIGIFYFYRLIKIYFDEKVAFNSSIILLFSLWFSYSRKIMPDTFSISFLFMGLFYGINYLTKGNRILHLLLYILFSALGTLSKLPAGYLLILFAPILLDSAISLKSKVIFSGVSLLFLSIVGIWYFYWVSFLVEKYNFWYFYMGSSFIDGFHVIFVHWGETLDKFYEASLKYIGFTFFISGLVLMFLKKEKILITIFILTFSLFILFIFKSGFTFYRHIYYILPFVPIMALVAGYAVSQIKKKTLVIIILVAIGIEGTINQQQDFRIKKPENQLLKLEADLDKVSKRNDLVIINSGDYPTPMYIAHRKGWVNYNELIAQPRFIDSLKTKGLKYIIILKQSFGTDIKLNYPELVNKESWSIYKI